MEYSLTLLDLAVYVAGHAERDIVGLCRCPTQGLLTRVLRTKYPELRVLRVRVYEQVILVGQWQQYPLSPEVRLLGHIFDERTGKAWREGVTKHEFLAAWNAWTQNNYKEMSVYREATYQRS